MVTPARQGLLILGLAGLQTRAVNSEWVNYTVYHTNQANYSAGDIADMNTADDLGDLEFTVRAKQNPLECATPAMSARAPWDCANPEQDATDLAVTKLIVSVDDDRIGAYCPCNVKRGVYSCKSRDGSPCAGFGATPVGKFLGHIYNASKFNASTPEFKWFDLNVLNRFGQGMWFSTTKVAECSPGLRVSANGGPCSWRVEEVVKRVARNCSDAVQEAAIAKASGGCFDRCPQPTNKTSTCWVDCYFRTLLGKRAGNAVSAPTDGMPLADVRAAWASPFQSDNPAQGGCPPD